MERAYVEAKRSMHVQADVINDMSTENCKQSNHYYMGSRSNRQHATQNTLIVQRISYAKVAIRACTALSNCVYLSSANAGTNTLMYVLTPTGRLSTLFVRTDFALYRHSPRITTLHGEY